MRASEPILMFVNISSANSACRRGFTRRRALMEGASSTFCLGASDRMMTSSRCAHRRKGRRLRSSVSHCPTSHEAPTVDCIPQRSAGLGDSPNKLPGRLPSSYDEE